VSVTTPAAGSSVQAYTPVTAKASFSDPGTGDTHTCTVTWGDGSSSTGTVSETSGAGTCTATHTYTAVGSYTITFKVTDNGGAFGTASVAVGITAPPTLTFTSGPSQSANEGSSVTYNLGSFSGGAAPYTVLVTWGDGTSSSFSASPGAISSAHKYANDGSYIATVKVTDTSGASASGSFGVTVANVAPTVTVNTPAAGSSVQTNTSVSAKATFSDAGTADTHTCTITWGDGSSSTGTVSEASGTGTCTASHSYTTVGSYTITFKVTDSAGASTSASVALTVTAPPALVFTVAGSQTASEGSSKTFSLGSFSGGVGPYTVLVTWGDGTSTTFSAAAGAISAAHSYVNDGPKTVTVMVTDATGTSATGSFSVTVANVAPTVTIKTPTGGSLFKSGATVSLSASFSDAGTSDTHTCKVAWGDGTTTNGTVSETGGAGTCTGSHAYPNVGNYTITVTVTDNGGSAGTASVAISVTRNGHGIFLPAGVFAQGLQLTPLHAHVAIVKTKHAAVAKKTKHHVTNKSLSPAALSALRRVLRFEPKSDPMAF
jgi:hypothetical protein